MLGFISKGLASGVFAIAMFSMQLASACDGKYVPVDKPDLQKNFDVLENAAARKTERVFAFKTVVCSDEPEFRRMALEAALTSNDTMLRALGLAELLMQRERIRIDLMPPGNLDPETKNWIDRTGGALTFNFAKRNRSQNCIGIGGHVDDYVCQPPMVKIDGLAVRLMVSTHSPPIIGDFSLEPNNTLKGTIKYGRGVIPAKIELLTGGR